MSHRITIRLDDALYDRLLTYAQGRANGQTPEVSGIVREALERFLRPQQGQRPRLTKRQGVRQT